MHTQPPALFLLDNGSLEPAATLNLRRLAEALGNRLGRPVQPVSLLHSHKVPAEQLEGRPAEIFSQALRREWASGQRDFLVLPLFFGPSGALVDYLPQKVTEFKAAHHELRLRIAPWLIDLQETERSVCAILEENLRGILPADEAPPRVILVDHGSPKADVTALRNELAARLAKRLGPAVEAVIPASMERRPEPEYDFNKPLLEDALKDLAPSGGLVLLSMLFLSPGRHAGPDGDIAQICAEAMHQAPGLRILSSPLVGSHPGLIDLLAKRYQAGLQSLPL